MTKLEVICMNIVTKETKQHRTRTEQNNAKQNKNKRNQSKTMHDRKRTPNHTCMYICIIIQELISSCIIIHMYIHV